MREKIEVGDLVIIVRAHCMHNKAVGTICRVVGFEPNIAYNCRLCFARLPNPKILAVLERKPNELGRCDPAYLKRINPPAAKDSTETDKEIPCLTV